jgi:c-di-GMP-binding flagellar brake protein YcgR
MQKIIVHNRNLPINIWDKIEIVVQSRTRRSVYISRIEDIEGDVLVVSKPDFIEGNKLLTSNMRVYVQFYKQDDAMYRMSAIIQSIVGDPKGRVKLYSRGRLRRFQRRNFVRINKSVDLKYTPLKNAEGDFLIERPNWLNSYSKDISAGGMLMRVNNGIRKNDILLVRMRGYAQMGIPRLLSVICCRIAHIDGNNFAGVEFIIKKKLRKYFKAKEIERLPPQVKEFSTQAQNKMVRYIFNEQVKERQKGLI